MNDCSSSNIYEGYCQIKKSTGNTVKNGADRLRADDCHPRGFEQTLVSENFHFPISNFLKQFQGWRCCRKCDPILMMIIMIIMVKWSLLSWWWWGGGKHKRWFYTKYLSRTPNFLSGVKISWFNLIINVRGEWEQGILQYFENVFHWLSVQKKWQVRCIEGYIINNK